MSLKVTYQAVGVYAFFPQLELSNITENSTIKDILDAVKELKSSQMDMFEYDSIPIGSDPAKQIVTGIGYRFVEGTSTVPPNSKNAKNGYRFSKGGKIVEEGENFFRTLVWQYYRGVTGTYEGSNERVIIRLPSIGQPLFSNTTLFEDIDRNRSMVPGNFNIESYDLTHRIVAVPKPSSKLALYKAVAARAEEVENAFAKKMEAAGVPRL